jgi:hypothetical protein
MNTIKKATLIAAITAMAAFAVPSMASAAGWAPLNTNKTLTSTNSATYQVQGSAASWGFVCSSSSLGVHVRTPASSTLDITSASFTGCTAPGFAGQPQCGPVTVVATGLPWAATSSGFVTFTEHLQVTYTATYGCGPLTTNVDGPASGTFSNSLHSLGAGPATGMTMTYMGLTVGPIANSSTQWHDATNLLTLT